MTDHIDWTDPVEAGRLLVRQALLEDRVSEDAASSALGDFGDPVVTCSVNTRHSVVVAGVPLAAMVFSELPGGVTVKQISPEGAGVSAGTCIASLTGRVSDVLRGERVFLNILGRLCGIATVTSEYVNLCSGTGVQILDTRKTTPGMRALEKYAVRTGGGTNHRFSLADMAMLKDNHLAAAGSVQNLEKVMKKLRRRGIPVEIEVDNLHQLEQVLHLMPERILLDNMEPFMLRKAVSMCAGTGIYLEASGGINTGTVRAVAETGVDGISVGALTHSVKCADIGLDWVFPGGEK